MSTSVSVRGWWNKKRINFSCEIDLYKSGEVGRSMVMEKYNQRGTKRFIITWEKMMRKVSRRRHWRE